MLAPLSFIHRYITVAKAAIYYFVPLSIIGILYALMARRLHLSAKEMPGELVSEQLHPCENILIWFAISAHAESASKG